MYIIQISSISILVLHYVNIVNDASIYMREKQINILYTLITRRFSKPITWKKVLIRQIKDHGSGKPIQSFSSIQSSKMNNTWFHKIQKNVPGFLKSNVTQMNLRDSEERF
jgi:hypothetical protein